MGLYPAAEAAFEGIGGLLMDIFIQNISKSYGEKQVLSHFSCVIPQGSNQAVMAPSGT